jgi:hypothetical protein
MGVEGQIGAGAMWQCYMAWRKNHVFSRVQHYRGAGHPLTVFSLQNAH